jgi:hypothetical protein
VHRPAALREPLYQALLSSILQSQVWALDETPSKAGHTKKGQLETGSFWPLSGDQDEGAFPFAASRAGAVGREAVGTFCGVLLTEGSLVYARFAPRVHRLVHAQGGRHPRRQFVEAAPAEPVLVAPALDHSGALYKHEALLRQRGLEAEAKLADRAEYAKPRVEAFFLWLQQPRTTQPLLPATPFPKAAR